MEIKLRLNDNIDADIIAEIKKIANDGPLSKALYRIVLEWHLSRKSLFGPKRGENPPKSDQTGGGLGQNEDNLADVLSSIDQEW